MKSDVSPWAVWGLYLVALIMAVTPLVELGAMVWPYRPGDLIWRYGALGLAAGHVPNVTVGFALLLALACWRGHARTLRAASFACLVVALLLLPAMAMFALDVGQVRALRPEELRGQVLVSALMQELKYLASGAAMACLGLGGLSTGVASSSRKRAPGILRAGELGAL
jgi:hypothetical protein